MEFLLPYLENREIHSNLGIQEPSSKHSDTITELSDTINNTSCAESLTDPLGEPDIQMNPPIIQGFSNKKKKNDHAEDMVQIMRENALMRKERYEKKSAIGNDEVELFYISMAKIAKRLPKSKEAKLRMEVCNIVSKAELAHLAEMETLEKEQTLVTNKGQITHYPVFSENQNRPQLFQSLNSNVLDEHSESSWSSATTYSNREAFIGNQMIYEEQSHSGSLNQYESL